MRKHTPFVRTLLIALCGIGSFPVTGSAQNISGTIVGTVSDADGAVLPGAPVTVTDLGTGAKRSVTTDAQGNYQILSLPLGEYKIEVDGSGFKHFSRSPIDVLVDQRARVNVTMVLGEQTQEVVVNTAPPIMQTDSASLGHVLEGKAVQTSLSMAGTSLASWHWSRG